MIEPAGEAMESSPAPRRVTKTPIVGPIMKPAAIVIPETIDAIRALTGIVRDANESIAKTDAALGIEATLV